MKLENIRFKVYNKLVQVLEVLRSVKLLVQPSQTELFSLPMVMYIIGW